MKELKFNITVNPFGIVYNSDSIHQQLQNCLSGKEVMIEDLVQSQGKWYSFLHHGSYSEKDPDQLRSTLRARDIETRKSLNEANVLIITLGTAFVFRRTDNNKIVANCHKLPARHFTRELLTSDQIETNLLESIKAVRDENPNVRVILTVSPIRHVRDGLVDNQRSKATLLQAVHNVIRQMENISYFPAYEIMMDDLRDYRFYKSDLIHPNEMALDYIWEKWLQFGVADESKELISRISKIMKAVGHRPIQDSPDQLKKFATHQLNSIQEIQSSRQFLDFSEEMAHFKKFV